MENRSTTPMLHSTIWKLTRHCSLYFPGALRCPAPPGQSPHESKTRWSHKESELRDSLYTLESQVLRSKTRLSSIKHSIQKHSMSQPQPQMPLMLPVLGEAESSRSEQRLCEPSKRPGTEAWSGRVPEARASTFIQVLVCMLYTGFLQGCMIRSPAILRC